MKGIKRIISMFLCCVIAAAIFTVMPISAFAATEPDHAYWTYTEPTVVLKKGNSMTKSNVKWLQSALNDLAYRGDKNNNKLNLRSATGDDYLTVDGSFGTKTDKAVRAFQKQYSLTVDGAFGTNSRNKMKAVYKDPTTCAHDWENVKIIREATCQQTGLIYRKCKKCPATSNLTVSKKSHKYEIYHSGAFLKKKCIYNCGTVEFDTEKTFRYQLDNYGGFTHAMIDNAVNDVNAFYETTDEIRKQSTDLGRWFELCSTCTGCKELLNISDSCKGLNDTCDYFDLAWTARNLVNKKANGEALNKTELYAVIDALYTLCSNTPGSTYYTTALSSVKDAASKMMKVVEKRALKEALIDLATWDSSVKNMSYKQISEGSTSLAAYNEVIKHYNCEASTVNKKLFSTSADYWNFFKKMKKEQSKFSESGNDFAGFLHKHYGI